MILTRWWTLGTVFETIQALVGETVAPEPDGTHRQTHVLGDGGISLICGDTQNDLRTIGCLLGGRAGGHPTLQLGALGHREPNSTATLFGHARNCLWSCFPSQPAELRIHSKRVSTNRKGY